jgi:hypothetical protein
MLAERSRDVGVALGLAELGVPEDLLNHADANALVEKQGRGRVACIVDPGVAEAGRTDERAPVAPVFARIDRCPKGRAEEPASPASNQGFMTIRVAVGARAR